MIRTTMLLAAMAATAFALPMAQEGCLETLRAHCNASKVNPIRCHDCVLEYGKAALCTADQERQFCDTTPGPAPDAKCIETLSADCGKERQNKSLCLHCIDEHNKTISAAGCTIREEDAFCTYNPIPPGTRVCISLFEEYCGIDRRNKTQCEMCVRAHEVAFKEHNCSLDEEERYCTELPPHPPSPPPVPHNTCYKTLYDECEKDRANLTLCVECGNRYDKTSGCTKEEIDMFCHVPNPAPNDECFKVLTEDCEKDAHNLPACVECAKKYEEESKCTPTQVEEFCHVEPTSCSRVFEQFCGVDRHNVSMCERCIERHVMNITKAHCSEAAGIEFCKGPPKPEPSDKCHEVLVGECGQFEKGSMCIECEARHKEQTTAAKCTATELSEFCKPIRKASIFDTFSMF